MISCDDLVVAASGSKWLLNIVGGFLGGTSLLVYVKPSGVGDGVMRIMVSSLSGFFLAPLVIEKIWDNAVEEQVLGVSFMVGFISWNLLGAVSLWMDRRKDKDVAELISEVKKRD